MLYRQFFTMTSNSSVINFKKPLKVNKFRVSMIRFITNNIGARFLLIKCDNGLSQHPIDIVGVSEYTKIQVMYSGTGLDVLYTNDTNMFDSSFTTPKEISQMTMLALINGSYTDAQISALNPLQVEIEIDYDE